MLSVAGDLLAVAAEDPAEHPDQHDGGGHQLEDDDQGEEPDEQGGKEVAVTGCGVTGSKSRRREGNQGDQGIAQGSFHDILLWDCVVVCVVFLVLL